MALEYRNRTPYYYRKRRVNGRVRSEYVGGGAQGYLFARLDQAQRAEVEAEREAWQLVKDEQQWLDQLVNDVSKAVDAYVTALLLVTGHHKLKRQWRKKRHGSK